MNISAQPLTNQAFGFPRGAKRRLTPYVLGVVHQTSNATANAQNERDYANRPASPGPSATYYIDRDGSVIEAVDAGYASWSSGDVRAPDLSISTVAQMVADRAVSNWSPPMNANEAVWDQYECCGTGEEPWTDAQFDTVAQLIAARAEATGLPIDRTTVLAHRDINTIDRATDPWPADRREARMARLIDLANAYLNPQESRMIGVKIVGPAVTVKVRPNEGHLLISPIDSTVRFGPADWPELAAVPVDVKDAAGAPIDIDGNQPPLNGRDQCYLVDDPSFGVAALALRADCDVLAPAIPTPTVLPPGVYEFRGEVN